MKAIRFAAAIGLALAALAFVLTPAVFANQPAVNPPFQSNSTQTTKAPNPDEHFAGVIVWLNGNRYILRDDVNDTWYHLDDQQTAAKYLGKKVSVTGTLDGRSDMIHVRAIHPVSKT